VSLDTDDEILQDFLVEAGELLDGLSEQLVELEQNPQDRQRLDAVFRGFHTIKGGAGFLNLNNLVSVCHRAEDVFNVLRQGQRQVDSSLMDAVLQVLDVVMDMFQEIRSGQEPSPADPNLLSTLESLAKPDTVSVAEAAQPSAPTPPLPKVTPKANPAPDRSSAEVSAAGGDDMTEEEFEALLDAMEPQGTGSAPVAPVQTPESANPATDTEQTEVEQDSDLMTDDEFERLLDQLHGEGQPPKSDGGDAPPPPTSTPPPAPSKKPSPKAVKPAPASPPVAETTVRVDTKRLDDIMNLVGELVLVRNRLATLHSRIGDEEVSAAVSNLDAVTSDLQTGVMKTRMQPVKKVFGRFPRVVRDLARSLNKEINLELRGEDTDLDKNQVEALADPLVHLVRNAVDHGIEDPDERERKGKPRAGQVVLAAEQEGDHILLTISDDGQGMDADVLRRKAVEKGLMDEEAAARMSDQNALNMIFMAGFTTKAQISDVSGRGVGMDVVKTRIAQLNGTVEIDSVYGQGSTLRIKVPLTLAILPTLMVVLGNQRFALPLASISEIFNLEHSRTHHLDHQEVVMVRDEALPLYHLRRWLTDDDDPPADNENRDVVVVVFVGKQRVGFVVDRLIGQEEVVIKPLGAYLQGLPGFAGATITGDGGVALILDIPGLVHAYARRS
jgi:two-component system chemotaxis sensor kinase CheA